MKIKNIKKGIRAFLDEIRFRIFSPRMTEVERVLIREIRFDDAWTRNRFELKKAILNKDLRNFLHWNVVTKTMFHKAKIDELKYLQSLDDWDMWSRKIVETKIGNPPPHMNI